MHQTIKNIDFRRASLILHRVIAVIFGLIFSVICATGSLSLYNREFDELLNRQLVVANPQGSYTSIEHIVSAIKTAQPSRHDAWILEMPTTKHGMITAWYDNPHESFDKLYAPLMVTINPYTAEVVASRFWGKTLVTRLMDLHKQLSMETFGWNLVGLSGLMLVISIISGFCLWWPQRSARLTLQSPTRLSKLLAIYHPVLGLLAALPLLTAAATGFHLSFPVVLETVTGSANMSHGNEAKNILSTANPTSRSVSADEATLIARGPFPSAELRRIVTPAGETGSYRINLAQSNEVSRLHPYTWVWVDRWSGQIREVRNPRQFSASERFIAHIWSIHSAESASAPMRLLWFIAGLTPLLLLASGTLLFLLKKELVRDRLIDFCLMQRQLQKQAQSLFHRARQCLLWCKPYVIQLMKWLLSKYKR